MKSYHETGSAKATTQTESRKSATEVPNQNQNIRSDFLLFVMIVHKTSQTVLSVFFAAIVAIIAFGAPGCFIGRLKDHSGDPLESQWVSTGGLGVIQS